MRLVVEAFDAVGEDGFLKLPAQRLVGPEKTLARELLRDRAAALGRPAVTDVRQRRRENPDGVDALMLVEALIFDVEDRVNQIR